jgi:uncharacterized cupredoxin-like copper-binding protein
MKFTLKNILSLFGMGAVFDAILVPAQRAPVKIAALATGTSSTEQAFGNNEIIAINATSDVSVKFGPAGLGAAAATDFRIPSGTTMVFDLGRQWTSVRFWNLGAGNTDIYIMVLSKF